VSVDQAVGLFRTFEYPIVTVVVLGCIAVLASSWRATPTLGQGRATVARWADRRDTKALRTSLTPSDGLLVGIDRGAWLAIQTSPTRRELRHLLVCGPTGSGKGLLAVSQLLSWRGSAIVSDPKGGELYRATGGWRSTFSNVIVLDPTGRGHGYDPIASCSGEAQLYAAALSLLGGGDQENGAIFNQRAAGMLACLFAAAQREQVPGIAYVRHLVRLGLQGAAERLNRVDPQLATEFLDRRLADSDWGDRFLASSWGTLVARLRPLLTADVAGSLSCSSFAGRDFYGDKPLTVYLCWPETQLEALAPVVRLVWESLLREVVTWRDGHPETRGKRLLALIDEAGRAPVPGLAEYATTVLSREIALWIGVQSRSQLVEKYGTAAAQTLLDNMDASVYYRPTDLATARFLEERTGSTLGAALAVSQAAAGGWTQSQSERAVPLRATHETFTMAEDDAVAFVGNLPPIRLQRGDWREDEDLEARHSLPVPTAPQLPTLPALPTLADPDADGAPDADDAIPADGWVQSMAEDTV